MINWINTPIIILISLIKNTYVKAFGNIFRQDKVVIMGRKSSGGLLECSLIVDEYFIIRMIGINYTKIEYKFCGV